MQTSDLAFDTWMTTAADRKINVYMVGFLSYNKTLFEELSVDRWEAVATLLDKGEFLLTDLVYAIIGEKNALLLNSYIEIYNKLPASEKILSGEVTSFNSDDLSVQHALIMVLCHKLKMISDRGDLVLDKNISNVFRFVMDNFQPEYVIYFVTALRSTFNFKMDFNFPEAQEFTEKYGRLMMAAFE